MGDSELFSGVDGAVIVMAANSGNFKWHYWAGKFGNCGHIYSPGGERGPIVYSVLDESEYLPYVIDNGAFPAWTKDEEWDEPAFVELLNWVDAAAVKPMWVAAPDVVTDRAATLAQWDGWAERIRARGHAAALVVQDGMTPADVKAAEPDVVFIGGSTKWKWLWLFRFAESHPRVHVGRVNGYEPLVRCYQAGAESADGTGWFRGDMVQLDGLRRFLQEQAEGRLPGEETMFSG